MERLELLDAQLYDVIDRVRALDEAWPYARARAAIVREPRQPVFGPVDAHAGDRQPSPTALGPRTLVEHRSSHDRAGKSR